MRARIKKKQRRRRRRHQQKQQEPTEITTMKTTHNEERRRKKKTKQVGIVRKMCPVTALTADGSVLHGRFGVCVRLI